MPALFLAAGAVRDTYTGSWSPYTLLFVIFMAFIGLALAIALLILAMMGRIHPRPAPKDEDAELTPYERAQERKPTRSEKSAAKKEEAAAQKAAQDVHPKRDTGWQHLLGAIGCSLASLLVFNLVDNPLGRMRSLTFGAVLNFLLFALQIFLTVQFILRQRRLR